MNLCKFYQCCSIGQSKGRDMKFHCVAPKQGFWSSWHISEGRWIPEYWAMVKAWGLLHRAGKYFCRMGQNHGASPLVSILQLSCRNQVQCPPALGPLGHKLWTFYVSFAVSCCLFIWSRLKALPWRNHSQKHLALSHCVPGCVWVSSIMSWPILEGHIPQVPGRTCWSPKGIKEGDQPGAFGKLSKERHGFLSHSSTELAWDLRNR